MPRLKSVWALIGLTCAALLLAGPALAGNCKWECKSGVTGGPKQVSPATACALEAEWDCGHGKIKWVEYDGKRLGLADAQALGAALLLSEGIPPNDVLRVSNIGSSGLDGVRMVLTPPFASPRFGWEPLDPSATLGASTLQIESFGTVNSIPDHLICSSVQDYDDVSGLLTVTPDCSAIGATSYRYEVFLSGLLVDSVDLQIGGVEVEPLVPGTGAPFSVVTRTGDDIHMELMDALLTLPGGLPVIGDELRIIPEDATLAVESISAVEITAVDIPSIGITSMVLLYLDAVPVPSVSLLAIGMLGTLMGAAGIRRLRANQIC